MGRSRTPIELTEILQRVEKLAAEVVRPSAEGTDREARWPIEALAALQREGVAALTVPAASGGLGQGLLALIRVCELIGRECTSTALCYGMHCVGSAVLAAKATPDQQQRYLEPIAAGAHITTLALSEPGTGIHFYFPQTQLHPDGDDAFRATGAKTFVTNGDHADSYVVSTVAADPGASPHEFSCVVIPHGAEGVTWGEPWDGLGVRGNCSVQMNLENVPLSRRDLLGEPGDQLWYVFNVITPYFLAAMTGTYIGIARAALAEALAHLEARVYSHGGTSPAGSAVVQHRLGELWARVERTRHLAYAAGDVGDEGGDHALELLFSAKAEAADCAEFVANQAMTLTGGISYRRGRRLERCLRDARAAPVMSPTTDLLRVWTGRSLLGLPILGD